MMEIGNRSRNRYYWGEVEEYVLWGALFWSFDVSCCIWNGIGVCVLVDFVLGRLHRWILGI
jgi:hypothetical protein